MGGLHKVVVAVGCAALWWAASSATAHAGKLFYVYKDEHGQMRMSDAVPPEIAGKGYRVVNEQGMTVKEVPPLTVRAQRPALDDHDRSLLGTFRNVDEIREARERQLKILDDIIAASRSTVVSFENNLEELQAQARDYRKQGQDVPSKLRDHLDSIAEQIRINRDYIARQLQLQEDTRVQFALDERRFVELQRRRSERN